MCHMLACSSVAAAMCLGAMMYTASHLHQTMNLCNRHYATPQSLEVHSEQYRQSNYAEWGNFYFSSARLDLLGLGDFVGPESLLPASRSVTKQLTETTEVRVCHDVFQNSDGHMVNQYITQVGPVLLSGGKRLNLIVLPAAPVLDVDSVAFLTAYRDVVRDHSGIVLGQPPIKYHHTDTYVTGTPRVPITNFWGSTYMTEASMVSGELIFSAPSTDRSPSCSGSENCPLSKLPPGTGFIKTSSMDYWTWSWIDNIESSEHPPINVTIEFSRTWITRAKTYTPIWFLKFLMPPAERPFTVPGKQGESIIFASRKFPAGGTVMPSDRPGAHLHAGLRSELWVIDGEIKDIFPQMLSNAKTNTVTFLQPLNLTIAALRRDILSHHAGAVLCRFMSQTHVIKGVSYPESAIRVGSDKCTGYRFYPGSAVTLLGLLWPATFDFTMHALWSPTVMFDENAYRGIWNTSH